jgi:DNA-binding NarL/FixJ family response regulator
MINHVMLVDDNQKFLAVLREFLNEYNDIDVIAVAGSGEEALALLDSTQPAVLIVDLWMPDMGGLDLTRKVKARWPQLPVIVLTLFDSPRHRQAALDAGADAFVGKARMDADLLPAIQSLIGASSG